MLTGCVHGPNPAWFMEAEESCARECSAEYSECAGKFAIFPEMHKKACVDGARACTASCPSRK